MKKILLLLPLLLFSCKSVDNWDETPVLSQATVEQAIEYISQQESYLELIRTRNEIDVKDNLPIAELDKLLLIEKRIALSSKKLANSWFDFHLQLRQDPGFKRAYSGYPPFKKGIDALKFSEKSRNRSRDISIKESKYYNKVLLLEGECRLAIGQIVAYNRSDLDTKKIYKALKNTYRAMD